MEDAVSPEKVIKGLECCQKKVCIYKDTLKECPYWELCGEHEDAFNDCTKALAKDALALLKANEEAVNLITKIDDLQKRPRVLTIEEALDAEVNVDQCWLEVKGCKQIHQANAGELVFQNHCMMVVIQRWGLSNCQMPIDLYGSYWRMWNKKPTEEQRKEVEWDD